MLAERPTTQRVKTAIRNSTVAKRVRVFDRLADVFIRIGGIAVIAVVALIFVFLGYEAWPLIRGATQETLVSLPLSTKDGTPARPMLIGLDEYETHGYWLDVDSGSIQFFDLETWAPGDTFALPTLAETKATAAYRLPSRDKLLIGTADGRVVLAEVRFQAAFAEAGRTVTASAREIANVEVFDDTEPVRLIHGQESDTGDLVFAAVSASGTMAYGTKAEYEPSTTDAIEGPITGTITAIAIDSEADVFVAATDDGRLFHWYLQEDNYEPYRTYDFGNAQNGHPITATALDFVIGDMSILLGFNDGRVEQWAGVRESEAEYLRPLHPINTFKPLPAAVSVIQPSGRDKGFLVGGTEGTIHLKFTTSRRTLLESRADGPVRLFAYAPKLTSYLALDGSGRATFTAVDNPHPEVSLRVLFGKVHYEGYDEPEHVWQSTGGTDSFESKLNLVPLLVGTFKGAFYGLLFAVPISVLAALYSSQFMPPNLRAVVKPTVEIMAALPSVVVGFLAGLWLAPVLETRLVGTLLVPLLLPAVVVVAAVVWHQVPIRLRSIVPAGWDLVLLIPVVAFSIWLSLTLGPFVEAAFFGGGFKQWVFESFGQQVGQRNSIVIGIALGFAVIPIIFTISDDAFSNVPASFKSGSFALGASPWQTAFRVVLPTASPGVFSATMIGFGRAVGETMIVLMATGNTPILSFSPFNGMRTLSANIAVEIPEAPAAGTLYRVLFVTAILLFILTFCVNTVAEVVRQRLRQRYQAV